LAKAKYLTELILSPVKTWAYGPAPVLIASGCALGLGIIVAVALFLWNARREDLSEAAANLQRRAVLVADQADLALQAMDLIHRAAVDQMQRLAVDTPDQFDEFMSTKQIFEDLKSRAESLPQFEHVLVVDARGNIINRSDGWPTVPINVSDRAYFVAAARDRASATYIGAPVLARLTGILSIPVARRVENRNGVLLGVLLASVPLAYFEDVYRNAVGGPGSSIALWRNDGVLLVRFPSSGPGSGRPFGSFDSPDPLFNASPSRAQHAILHGPWSVDGMERLVAKEQLAHEPVVAVLTLTEQEALHRWQREALLLCLATLLLQAGIAGIVWLGLVQLRIQAALQRAAAAQMCAETSELMLSVRETAKQHFLLAVERERSEQSLRAQYERFEFALDHMALGLLMVGPDERLIVANRQVSAFLGVPGAWLERGAPLSELVQRWQAAKLDPKFITLHQQLLQEMRCCGSPVCTVCEDVLGRTLQVCFQPLSDGGWVNTFEDITEQRRTEARIAHMAQHDALTDLPNRALLRQRLEQGLAHCGRGRMLAVLWLDLDRFKHLNDTLGQLVGDRVLQRTAMLLMRCARVGDTVARLGSDEFVVVQEDIAQGQDAVALAERLIEEIGLPCEVLGQPLTLGASVGIAVAPQDGGTADMLLRNAKLALRRAREDGRERVRFFETEMDVRMRQRQALELDLRRGLTAGEFVPYFQPIVDARTRRVCGFEALTRWLHPERGVVLPGAFIGQAEEMGLIEQLGETMLVAACKAAAGWSEPLKVAVNLSALQFKRGANLVRIVTEAVTSAGLEPGRLELEITESLLLRDTIETVALLHEMRMLGIRIVMDDFGTGYSSVGYLVKFPFDKVKIDQSFVRGLGQREECDHVVRAVIGLCDGLGITTTAEGVETLDQLGRLASEGCTEVQGYLFGRPMPAAEVPELLAQGELLAVA
jgi:diguanylate cyclase (GGDEF)-like protein